MLALSTMSFSQEKDLANSTGNIRVNFMAFKYDLVSNPLVTKDELKYMFKQCISTFKSKVSKDLPIYVNRIDMDLSNVIWTQDNKFIVLDVKMTVLITKDNETILVTYTTDMIFDLKSGL